MTKEEKDYLLEFNSDIVNVVSINCGKIYSLGAAVFGLLARPKAPNQYEISLWQQLVDERKQLFSYTFELTDEEFAAVVEDTKENADNICSSTISSNVATMVMRDIIIYSMLATACPGRPLVDFNDKKYLQSWKTDTRVMIHQKMDGRPVRLPSGIDHVLEEDFFKTV